MESEGQDKLARVVAEIDTSSAEILRSSFNTLFDQADEWIRRAKEVHVTSVDQKREMKLARESRLALKELRVKAEHTRKRLKEDSVRYGRAIDGMANVLKALVEPIEAYLLEQETFAARREAEEEQKKQTLRAERVKVLEAFGMTMDEIGATADLREMSVEQWTLLADNARLERDRRVEAERQAEVERCAEAERQAEIARRSDREAADAKKRLKASLKENEQLKATMEENERLVIELKRAQAEREAQMSAHLAAEEALLMAPDREKLRAFADALKAIPLPILTTRQGRLVAKKLASGMKEMVSWVEKVSEELK